MNCRHCGIPLHAQGAIEACALGALHWNVCGPCTAAAPAKPAGVLNGPPAAADAFIHHLSAARGLLELGLPHEAWNELEAIEPADRRAEVSVLGLRVAIYHALERWEAMAEVCRHLATVQPGEVSWTMWLATATRHHQGPRRPRDPPGRQGALSPGGHRLLPSRRLRRPEWPLGGRQGWSARHLRVGPEPASEGAGGP